MRLHLAAVGRIASGAPERKLCDSYRDRLCALSRAIGVREIVEHEIDQRKSQGMAAEGVALSKIIPDGAILVALDERGKALSSRDLANSIEIFRAEAPANLVFLIGGADGLAPHLRARADMVLSFGPMVWPHMLVRVMLYEQLYRAATILTGGPYHRD